MIVLAILRLAYMVARRLIGGLVMLARSDAAKRGRDPAAASPTRRAAATDPATAADVGGPGGDGGAGSAVAAGTPARSAGVLSGPRTVAHCGTAAWSPDDGPPAEDGDLAVRRSRQVYG